MKFIHRHKSFSIIVLVLSISCLAFKNCGEKEAFPEVVEMIFVIPITIEPNQETYTIGSSFSIKANFPDTLYEFYSKKYYKVENFNFHSWIAFTRLTGKSILLSDQPANANQYEFNSIKGSIVGDGEFGRDVNYLYTNNHYQLEIELNPQSIGIYNFTFGWRLIETGQRLDIINLEPLVDGRKRMAVLRDVFFIVNNGENNFALRKENTGLAMDLNPTDLAIYPEKFGSFTFRVVE